METTARNLISENKRIHNYLLALNKSIAADTRKLNQLETAYKNQKAKLTEKINANKKILTQPFEEIRRLANPKKILTECRTDKNNTN